jgi:ABC-type uncharacterized transport system substrate-binding protein
LRELANKRINVVIVLATNLFVTYTAEVAAAALAMKLPTVCEYREHVIDGALIGYGGHGEAVNPSFMRSMRTLVLPA